MLFSLFWDSIQKYLSCKGGCLASVGPDQPAEVAFNAPKELVCCPVLLYRFSEVLTIVRLYHQSSVWDNLEKDITVNK